MKLQRMGTKCVYHISKPYSVSRPTKNIIIGVFTRGVFLHAAMPQFLFPLNTFHRFRLCTGSETSFQIFPFSHRLFPINRSDYTKIQALLETRSTLKLRGGRREDAADTSTSLPSTSVFRLNIIEAYCGLSPPTKTF
jgi:hypothetical protein